MTKTPFRPFLMSSLAILLSSCGADSGKSRSSELRALQEGCQIKLTYSPGTVANVSQSDFLEYGLVSEVTPRSLFQDKDSAGNVVWEPLGLTLGNTFPAPQSMEIKSEKVATACRSLYRALSTELIPTQTPNTRILRKSYFVSRFDMTGFPTNRAQFETHPAFASGPQIANATYALRIAEYETRTTPGTTVLSVNQSQDLPVQVDCERPFTVEAKDVFHSSPQSPVGAAVCQFLGMSGSESQYNCAQFFSLATADQCTVRVDQVPFQENGKNRHLSFLGKLTKTNPGALESRYQLTIDKIGLD